MYQVAFHPYYAHPVPSTHRFPMEKYELLPQQLLRQGIVLQNQFITPGLVSLDAVYAVHQKDYIDRFVSLSLTTAEARKIGFIQDELLVQRELLLVQGTIDTAVSALKDGIGFNIAGGTHHACYANGEGFCMINDQAVAAQFLLNHKMASRILIVDLDVHQGNGTADIFFGRADVFTFSMHGAHNYPFHKKQSHLDIGLPDGTSDEVYLIILAQHLKKIIDHFKPDFMFYQSGVDILCGDKMGKMSVTAEGVKARDQIVFSAAYQAKIPVQCSMGGGYSAVLANILNAHCTTFEVANDIRLKYS